MQIQLCEDDGLFHDGIPEIVVLVVKFDDGKTKRIPYPADKTISSLYQDLNAIAPKVAEAPQEQIDIPAVETPNEPTKKQVPLKEMRAERVPAVDLDKSNVIEKEDIVTMVKMHERDKNATCLLMVGMTYRVIEVVGPRHPVTQEKIAQGYDVIDDTAATPERMRVYPDEVVLKSKRVLKGIDKTSAIEEILPCPNCTTKNSLILEGSEFKGVCKGLGKEPGCGLPITIARVISKCTTVKCGQDVSCFDVGGKYAGTCGKCHALIEVPHA